MESFRGEVAAASLKRAALAPLAEGLRSFRGEVAAASLKPRKAASYALAAALFPRRSRRGLIEA